MASWAAMAAKPAAAPAPAPAAAPLMSNDVVSAGAADGSGVAANGAQPVLSSADEALRDLKKVVLDSGAIIKGGRLEGLGQKFWTIKEVLGEVRDSNARAVLDTLAVELEVREVDPAALAAVTHFAKLTGDYQRLSLVDLKVMALTYQMEKQYHGTAHLNTAPRPAMAAPAAQRRAEAADGGKGGGGAGAGDDAGEAGGKGEDDGEDEGEGEIDPSEFERVPLDEGASQAASGGQAEDDARSVAGSVAGSKGGARPKKKGGASSLPGWGEWEDGEQDEVGWITPDNLSGVRRMDQVEERAQDDSHVACATLDGAMQNVLLQMGLRVIDTDGYVVKNVKQFVLKCHACYKICQDTDKRFCPGRAGVVWDPVQTGTSASVQCDHSVTRFSPKTVSVGFATT